jgi:hypothetical protein
MGIGRASSRSTTVDSALPVQRTPADSSQSLKRSRDQQSPPAASSESVTVLLREKNQNRELIEKLMSQNHLQLHEISLMKAFNPVLVKRECHRAAQPFTKMFRA